MTADTLSIVLASTADLSRNSASAYGYRRVRHDNFVHAQRCDPENERRFSLKMPNTLFEEAAALPGLLTKTELRWHLLKYCRDPSPGLLDSSSSTRSVHRRLTARN
ncbi:hypothetical protein CVT25_009709 [Psilocybe cyanescens]|uniref:Uncharacterized protein n=1 Tax=Psilocybe cyanescens TaxID=93625 RepID=A0A409WWM4_PSICY|nr:hypothetical protein CVT25_009709 [Psilocybe cyanescens]